jgi:hypothetical protein
MSSISKFMPLCHISNYFKKKEKKKWRSTLHPHKEDGGCCSTLVHHLYGVEISTPAPLWENLNSHKDKWGWSYPIEPCRGGVTPTTSLDRLKSKSSSLL